MVDSREIFPAPTQGINMARNRGSALYEESTRVRKNNSCKYVDNLRAGINRVVCLVAFISLAVGTLQARSHTKTSAFVPPWYVSAAAIHRVTLKPQTQYWRFEQLSMKPAEAEQQMLAWKKEGITALEIFAPEAGGNSYDGLDAKDRFRLDPGLGSRQDFRRLVKQAHTVGLAVVTFQNLGYSSLDAPQFLKAEDDMRAGRDTREARFFFWSKTQNAPPPAMSNSYFLTRPKQPGYNPTKNEFWQWSDRAQQYYWTRWPGKDANGQITHLPQYNWAGNEWPAEAQKVVRFWMDTGLDGMILDAVNWYTGATWKKTNDSITGPISGYGHKFIQPEGGGAFHSDDPVGWVTEGTLPIYMITAWESGGRRTTSHFEGALKSAIRNCLRRLSVRITTLSLPPETLYMPVPRLSDAGQQQLAEALLATSGTCFAIAIHEAGLRIQRKVSLHF